MGLKRFERLFMLLLSIAITLCSVTAFALSAKTTYQAKILKPDGYPLEAANVNFKFTILDPAGSCILYSETFSAVNMASTSGLISFALGSGVKTYPASATTFEQVFSNITPTLSCDTGGPVSYSPASDDIRKIVMQFNDGTGWQTLPAMSIHAVPYAMYAGDAQSLGGVSATSYVKYTTLPSCGVSEALQYNGATFNCVALSGGGAVTSSTVITALGYTPASADLATQWVTSGSTINYSLGNIAIGVSVPTARLDLRSEASDKVLRLQYSGSSFGTQPNVEMFRSRGTIDLPTGVLANDTLGTISAGGHDNTNFAAGSAAAIQFKANAAFTSTSRSSYITFWTTASGTTTNTERLRITDTGNVGIGTTIPGAKLHLAAGTSALAPLKFSSGTLLASPASGSVEYDGFNLYYTDGTNTRRTLASIDSTGTQTNTSAITNTNDITIAPSGSVIVSSTAASTSSSTGALVINGGVGVAGNANIAGAGNVSGSLNVTGPSTFANSVQVASGAYFLGNVGIGTTNPSTKFTISANSVSTPITPNTGSQFHIVGVDNSSAALTIDAFGDNFYESPYLTLRKARGTLASPTAVTTHAILGMLQGQGWVGSGFSGGGGVAVVAAENWTASSTATTVQIIANGTSGTTGAMYFGGTGLSILTSQRRNSLDVSGSAAIGTFAGSVSAPANGLIISGNVGIGISVPNATLTVSGSSRFFTPGQGDINITHSGMISHIKAETGVQLALGASNTEVIRINNSGNVGIGTSSPTYTLDVSGTVRVSGQAYTNTGNGNFSILSDIRYKDVNGRFDRGLNEILNIDIIRFNYKKDNPFGSDSSRQYVGISAQNLKATIPEAVEVNHDKDKEYLTVNTSPVLWTLVNAVKQLYKRLLGVEENVRRLASVVEAKANKAEVDTLKSENAQLKKDYQKVQQENAAIKSYLCSKDPEAPICK